MGQAPYIDVVDQVQVAEQDEQQSYSVYPYDETPENHSWASALPVRQGLYDPEFEKDACGVGFAAYVFNQPHLHSLSAN